MTTAQRTETYLYSYLLPLCGDSAEIQTRVETDATGVNATVLLTLSDPAGVGLAAREARALAMALLEAAEAADDAEAE